MVFFIFNVCIFKHYILNFRGIFRLISTYVFFPGLGLDDYLGSTSSGSGNGTANVANAGQGLEDGLYLICVGTGPIF
jgi:hypothetical protein